MKDEQIRSKKLKVGREQEIYFSREASLGFFSKHSFNPPESYARRSRTTLSTSGHCDRNSLRVCRQTYGIQALMP